MCLLCIQFLGLGIHGYFVTDKPVKIMDSRGQELTYNQNQMFAVLTNEMQSLKKQLGVVPVDPENIEELRKLLKHELGILRADIAMEKSTGQQRILEKESLDQSETHPWVDPIDPIERAKFVEEASLVVQNAISDGEWTDKDSQEMAEYAPFLDPRERSELLETLGDAINSQQLAIDEPILF